jgi:hypothetical protein
MKIRRSEYLQEIRDRLIEEIEKLPNHHMITPLDYVDRGKIKKIIRKEFDKWNTKGRHDMKPPQITTWAHWVWLIVGLILGRLLVDILF